MSTEDFSAYSTAKTTRIKFDRVLVESKSTLFVSFTSTAYGVRADNNCVLLKRAAGAYCWRNCRTVQSGRLH